MFKRALHATVSKSETAMSRIELSPRKGDKLTRSALFLSTALGCSIAVFTLGAPQQAWAANECGPTAIVNGVDTVTCTGASNPYPSGILYSDASGRGLVVVLDNLTVVNTAGEGVFANNTAGGYTGVTINSGASVTGGAIGIAAYNTSAGSAFVDNYGSVSGGTFGILSETTGAGDVSVTNVGQVSSGADGIFAFAHDGNVGILTTGISISTNTITASAVYAKAYHGSDQTVSVGNIYVKNASGDAFGIDTAATYLDNVNSHGNVSVHGATYAIGIRASSGETTSVEQYGNVYAGSAGDAVGILAVGSNTASIYVVGDVTAISTGEIAIGVETQSDLDSGVFVLGSITAVGSAGAFGVYDKTLSPNNPASVIVGGDVLTQSSDGVATGVFDTTASGSGGGGDVDIFVGGNVVALGTTGATGVDADAGTGNSTITIVGEVGVHTANGDAVGVKNYSFYNANVSVGSVYAASINGNATGINNSAFGNVTTTVAGDVTAVSGGGYAAGVESTVTDFSFQQTITVGGNVTVTGYSGAVGVSTYDMHGEGADSASITGNITVNTVHGYATGVAIDVKGIYSAANSDVFVGGSISAYSKYGEVWGARVYSAGAAAIVVDGDVTAKSNEVGTGVWQEAGGPGDANDITVGGNVYASGFDRAIGVDAYRGDVNVHIGGNVTALTTFGYAIGVDVDGDAYIFVGGNVIAESFFGNSTGIYGNSSGYLGEHVDGGVYAQSVDDNAIGVFAGAEDLAKIYVAGAVIAKSLYGYATGVKALAGDVEISVGSVYADAGRAGSATGVYVAESDTLNIDVAGQVAAKSMAGYAAGIKTYSQDGTNITVGSVYAYSKTGKAIGIYASAYGDISIDVKGDAVAKSVSGYAVGIASYVTKSGVIQDYANRVAVGGNVVVIGYAGAVGIREGVTVTGYSNDYVTVGGNIVVKAGDGDAYGVVILAAETSTISVGGSVYAYSKNGDADGVDAIAVGNASTTIGGDVMARSINGGAYAVLQTAGATSDNDLTVTGNVIAEGFTGAVGVGAYGGDVGVNVGGNVYARAFGGNAYGVMVVGDSTILIGGNASAIALGNATAVYGNSSGAIHVQVDGNVYADAFGNATGVNSIAQSGDSDDYVNGSVLAKAQLGEAVGVASEATGAARVTVGGSVFAESYHGKAYGVAAIGDGYAGVNVFGNVVAEGYTYATGRHCRVVWQCFRRRRRQRNGHNHRRRRGRRACL